MALRLLVLVALAASIDALPSATDRVIPEGMMMQVAFSSMTPTAFISAMAKSGGSKADCGTFASTTVQTITTAVSTQQAILGALENGNNCAALGQTLVTSTKAAVVAAQKVVVIKQGEAETALAAKKAACSAGVDFSVGLELLESNAQCYDYTNQAGYTTAKAACDLKTSALTVANAAVVTAQTTVTDAQGAAERAVAEASRLMSGCLCRAHKAQTAGWAAATTAHASHAADWKQAHEILCALDSASTTCNVPTCPVVTKPAVATGVENAVQNHCTEAPTATPTATPTTATPTTAAPTVTDAPTGTPTATPTQTPAPTPPPQAQDCSRSSGRCASASSHIIKTIPYWLDRATNDLSTRMNSPQPGTLNGVACDYGSSPAQSYCNCQYLCQQNSQCAAFEVYKKVRTRGMRGLAGSQAKCNLLSRACAVRADASSGDFYGACDANRN